MFFKIGALKNFPVFIGKHQRWSLFLIKLQIEGLQRDSNAGAFLWILQNFKEHLFCRTPTKAVSVKWWNSRRYFLTLFLTDWCHMSHKNTIELSSVYWNVLLCTSIYFYLINFFIPPRQAEAITWENFILVKRDPSCTKEGSHLAGMKHFTCNRRM